MKIAKNFRLTTMLCKDIGNLANIAAVRSKQWSYGTQEFSTPRLANPMAMRKPFTAVMAKVAATLTLLTSGMVSAQTIDNPPLLPMNITVFPSRDFTSIEGLAPNADLLVQVRRGGVVSDAIGRTDATGFLEVNHPGGVCWRNLTPDIVAGDTVRVTYRDTSNNGTKGLISGSGAAVNTLNVTATQAFDTGSPLYTVVVKGNAVLAGGGRIPLNRLEVRIVNPEFIDPNSGPDGSRISKRDIRADSLGGRVDGPGGNPIPGTSGSLAYDSTGTTFTATFTGLNEVERQLAVSGQTRVMAWQQTTPTGDRLGMTIYEVDEIGGPGMGGCPAGPNAVTPPRPPTAPVSYMPNSLLDAADKVNQPSLKDVTVFPNRDFVSIEGFAPGTELQVIVRKNPDSKSVIGTARGIVPKGGIFEVNHPGGVCWTGQTPDIDDNNYIDVIKIVGGKFSGGQTQRVIAAKINKPAFITSTGEIRVNGVASTDNIGTPLPLKFMEQRIINPDFVNTPIDRRDIRADINGGRVDNMPGATGNLLRTGDNTSNQWRAVYTGLSSAQKDLAVAGQSRIMAWLSTNANGDRFGMTISESGEVGGPGMGGCPASGNATIAIP